MPDGAAIDGLGLLNPFAAANPGLADALLTPAP